ncbi:uncharacterized protein LOC128196228 [Vigna angularis]|uniref:uncharacterized protein LOC128196228 n=1 Tax=Phaseolus angularis TaxID=3914 RepID=UPI0022B57E9C|nr:uncharacterized protein LOC128196228 [Vigna angularis]
MACANNDANTVIKFLKRQMFAKFGTPRILISDGGSHFCNSQLAKVLKHYGVKHKVATPYHPQTNGFWRKQTAMKTTIGLSPFQLVYGKASHLPLEMEHRALWGLKFLNFDPFDTQDRRRRKLVKKVFHPGQQVLLFNSRLNLFHGKLKSKWSGPFMVKNVHPHGGIELTNPSAEDPQRIWVVNGQRLNHYLGGEVECLSTIMELVDL